jgi:hypothetical protein
MKRMKGLCLWLCLLLIFSVAASAQEILQETLGPINCTALRENLTTVRWLSLPDSRLVANPFLGDSGSAVDGVLPLNLAYYVGAGPAKLPAFWFLQPYLQPPAARGFAAGPRFSLSRQTEWETQGVTAVFANETVRVTSLGGFGALTRTVTVDLDKTPYLVVQTPPGSPSFDMKVNSGGQSVDTFLHHTERLGAATANVAIETGWHGVKTFQVLLYALGTGVPITFTRVQFVGLPDSAASSESNTWMPHEITAQAILGNAGGKVYSAVTLPDADTVSERLHLGRLGPSALVLTGQFAGTVRWDAARNTLLLQGDKFSAALRVSRKAQWLGVRPTQLDWALGEGQAARTGAGVWRLALQGLKSGDDIVVSARFSPSKARAPQASALAFSTALARNEAAWNRRLALVPRPLDFTPRSVDAKGVTAAQVRRSYYRAWVFFFQNTLPPMPENGFPYPQVCTGKPSLWIDGGTHMEETALWDGVTAMQALALVEPQEAWAAAQGILSRVDADGYLDGEALPTILAQTLWLLYAQTGDTSHLRDTYPALKRFLQWKIANPRWIYPNRIKPMADPNAPKDQEFVSYEIVDMGYMIKIAVALGKPNEAAFWYRQQSAAVADYQHWFWPAPGGHVYRIYGSDTDRGDPDDPWSLQGLQIDPSLLPPDESAALAALYKKTRNPSLPFWVPGRTRFGDLAPIALGLFQHGQVAEADQLAEACLRDVTRAGEFAEDYRQDTPPVPSGVRPSSFGARLMTDSVFWHNGVLLDAGLPILLGMPGAVGVDNISVHGDPLNVRFGPLPHTVTLRGPALAYLRRPASFHATRSVGGETLWVGPIQDGQQVPLQSAY